MNSGATSTVHSLLLLSSRRRLRSSPCHRVRSRCRRRRSAGLLLRPLAAICPCHVHLVELVGLRKLCELPHTILQVGHRLSRSPRPSLRSSSPCRATSKIGTKSVAPAPAHPFSQHGSRDRHHHPSGIRLRFPRVLPLIVFFIKVDRVTPKRFCRMVRKATSRRNLVLSTKSVLAPQRLARPSRRSRELHAHETDAGCSPARTSTQCCSSSRSR